MAEKYYHHPEMDIVTAETLQLHFVGRALEHRPLYQRPTTITSFFFGQLHLNGQRHEGVIVQSCIEKLCAHVEQKVPAFSVQVIYFLLSLVAQSVKNLPAMWETQVGSLGWEDPLEKGMAIPVFLPKEFHGQRSLAGYKSWSCKESDTTE